MEHVTDVLFKDISYLWMIFFIMISAGLAKEYNLFAPAYAYVKNTFRSNKFVVVLLSAIGGILPIEGRVTVSAGLLDTVAPKCCHGRQKLGIVDYLATHHYYFWSPIEKTVILPIAAFGLTYIGWLYLIAPLLIVSLAFISCYIWYQVHDEEVPITPGNFKMSAVLRDPIPMFMAIGAYVYGINHIVCFGLLTIYYILITQQWSPKRLLGYVKWDIILVVGAVIILGNYIKSNEQFFQEYVRNIGVDIHTISGMAIISFVGFIVSFLMGSSGKFAAFAVLLSQVFGQQYFLWFFAVEFAAYLVSPTHKCVYIGHRYFNTPMKTYYLALGFWALLVLVTGASVTYFKI